VSSPEAVAIIARSVLTEARSLFSGLNAMV
jgi:hypothetical protein